MYTVSKSVEVYVIRWKAIAYQKDGQTRNDKSQYYVSLEHTVKVEPAAAITNMCKAQLLHTKVHIKN